MVRILMGDQQKKLNAIIVYRRFINCYYLIATPVLIPPRQIPPHTRPMRSSVEGLNQEIEKLVLNPCQQHSCRPETNLASLLSAIKI